MPPKRKSTAKKSQTKKASSTTAAATDTTGSSKAGAKRAHSEVEPSIEEPAKKRGRKDAKSKNTPTSEPVEKVEDAPKVADNMEDATKNSKAIVPSGERRNTTETSDVSEAPATPILCGKFDLYTTQLPFLSEVYLAKGDSQPQHEELYKTILTYQAKPDYTAQFAIPDLSGFNQTGAMSVRGLCDPMSEEPYDVDIEHMEMVEEISYTDDQEEEFAGTPTTGIPGVTGELSISGGGCGIASSSGDFLMSRIWTKEGKDGKRMELFEGFLSMDISYSWLYQRKGHGDGMSFTMPFWAVRARKDANGKEIGPEC